MAQSPQANLPPLAQPWGRYIEKSITDIKETSRLAELNTKNNLKQLNSSVSLLARQQNTLEDQQATLEAQQLELETQQGLLEDQQDTLAAQQATLSAQQITLANQQAALTDQQNRLAAFKTYSSVNASTISSGTLNSVINLRALSTTFTLPIAAKVLININSNGVVYGLKYAMANNPTLRLTANIVVDGSYQINGTYGGGVTATVSSGYVGQQWEGPAYLSKIVTLSAGSHTVTGNWGAYVYSDSGGYSSISESVVTVQVIELTG